VARDKNELAVWSLAGEGWKECVHRAVAQRVLALNTPKGEHVADLLCMIGIPDVRSAWKRDYSLPGGPPDEELDQFVKLRCEIAHLGIGAPRVEGETVQRRDS
jgi:hypothetical protein